MAGRSDRGTTQQDHEERYAAQDKRENAKLGLYGESVRANAELARARAHAALNPKARGGGGGGTASTPTDVTGLLKEANDQGIIATPAPVAPAAPNITVVGGSSDGGSDGGAVAPPVSEPPPGDDGYAKGGMVRRRGRRRGRRYAEGGIVGGMSLAEAQSYLGSAPKSEKKPTAGDAFTSALGKGAASYKAPEEKKAEAPKVTATGPVGSGAGGSYTVADTQSGGVLDTRYRAGGAVRRYAEGGPVQSQDLTQGYDYKAAEKERETKTQQAQTEQAVQATQQAEEERSTRSRSGGAGSSFESAFAAASGSADGATGSGGDAAGGVSGSGGVGGSATGGAGGSAAAGTSGDAGSDGSGTYRRGGRVRRFQSGGRVMEAIDTGTSGPGSGYGYRAAPPARSY